jgi:uncharacterized membrane protein YkoI
MLTAYSRLIGETDAHFTRGWTRSSYQFVFRPLSLAAEKKIKRSALPPAVEKTVAAQSLGATVQGFSEERENGQIFYEAEMTVNGHNRDVLMDAGSLIVEVEEQVAMDSLPTDVQVALHTKAGKGKIVTVETITKHDRLVAYEAAVLTKGKRSEVQVDPLGKNVSHEE